MAFDDHVIEGNNYTAEEVMCYLENSEPGFTRLHVAPRHVITHSGRYTRGKCVNADDYFLSNIIDSISYLCAILCFIATFQCCFFLFFNYAF